MIFLLFLLLSLTSNAASASEQCYKISIPSPGAHEMEPDRKENWCYRSVSDGQLFVFNADEEKVRPELAFLLRQDGTIAHGSLMADKLSLHMAQANEINPFSVPLHAPVAFNNVEPVIASVDEESLQSTLELLRNFRADRAEIFDVETGFSSGSSAIKPWRGYWWPEKGRPMQLGPLQNFDRYVQIRSGMNPGSVWEEDRIHGYSGIWWEGHCNGWAAASVLRAEPAYPRAAVGVYFRVSDLKGILAETDYCAHVSFFGHRNNGGGNNGDIAPHVFHRVIRYYIGSLRKPVIADYRPDPAVDNNVISAYRMEMIPMQGNTYRVTTTLTMHKYDGFNSDAVGPAPEYTRVYQYLLYTDNSGNAVGGTWLSTNPDFLWVPLSPRSCRTNNQRLDRTWVDVILSL